LDQAKFEDSVAEVRSLQAELKKAEAALKRSKTKDYYKILGVARECTDVEIKKAYRKESLIHHPDKGGDEEKFKLVAEAFTVLSDPQRRQRYDMGEEDSEYGGGSGMGGMGPHDFSDLFAQFGGGMPSGFGGGGFGGGGFHSFHSHGGGRGEYPF
jgi:DnaJ family protein C protein 7